MAGDRAAQQKVVNGRGWTLEEIMTIKTFNLDYFQREYVWSRVEVRRLFDDLAKCFLLRWNPEHPVEAVQDYPSYFIGPIVTYRDGDKNFLADGQQRFTTLMLLLIHLRRMARDQGLSNTVRVLEQMISRPRIVGSPIFVVDVPQYKEALENLLQGRWGHDGDDYRVVRLHEAYGEIAAALAADPFAEALQWFAQWLCHRVSLVEIDAVDRQRAWTIYQTMNDRGVHLTPIDYLKGYLIDGGGQRIEVEAQWVNMFDRLERFKKGTTFEYIKTLFRSQFSDIQGQPDAPDRDAATHEWIKHNEKLIWPQNTIEARRSFTQNVVIRLSGSYLKLLKAAVRHNPRLASVYFNAEHGLDAQLDMMLACCRTDESENSRETKCRILSDFVDLLFVLHGVNNEVFTDLELQGVAERLLPQLSKCASVEDLQNVLTPEISALRLSLADAAHLRLRNDNRSFVHYLLARLTGWLDSGSQLPDRMSDYLSRQGNVPLYEVEHVFPAKQPDDLDMLASEYALIRSRIGALLLLEGSANAGLGAEAPLNKLNLYRGPLGNLLAASLHPDTYGRGSAKFRRFIKAENLHKVFLPLTAQYDIGSFVELRCGLYQAMIERVWDPVRLRISPAPIVAAGRGGRAKKRSYGVDFEDLVDARYIAPGTRLIGRLDPRYTAVVLSDGRIQTPGGATFAAPSPAAAEVLERAYNGWTFWYVVESGERIDAIRSRYLKGRR